MAKPKFSIIVPFIDMNRYVAECIRGCLNLSYAHFDIYVLPDNKLSVKELQAHTGPLSKRELSKIIILPTGAVKPGKKRNIAMKKSTADYFACIDSDAYPHKQWLTNSLSLLRYDEVGIVGGPNEKPHKTTYFERLAIKLLYLHTMVGGLYFNTKFKGNSFEYSEMASSNLIIKRDVAKKANYYDETLFPGEDVILCYNVIDKGYKIIYSPDVIVYHHRRPLFMKHLVKVKESAEIKGSILDDYKHHDSVAYYLPTLFMLGVILGLVLSFIHPVFLIIYLSVLVLYFGITIVDCIVCGIYHPLDIMYITIGAFLTHLFYGYGFLKHKLDL